eukprot:CAMPEP_0119331688 /NCGR_PEP_ID=MMETSP1333-20130426/81133_1 /TAXON_ID=418940 /ORGANISM="Scyphosphaera apsteinii, Strain RCC1455" /LENGTH=306 /DNA_ID=CAMNT_0007341351 /DNA_START=154 /DNA_END=1074 /DNA_ORIENTATION=-
MTGVTASVAWQRGDTGGAMLTTPFTQDLSLWTGQRAAAVEQAMVQSVVKREPWTAVQFTSDGIWGAALNTTGADQTAEHLTTTTLEAVWQGVRSQNHAPRGYMDAHTRLVAALSQSPSAGTCVDAFGNGRRGFAVELEMAAPFAFHEPRVLPSKPAAIYVSLSVYLHTPPGTPGKQAQFIWYSTPLFDLERDVEQDHVFIDIFSRKLIISGPVSGRSRYNTPTAGSSLARNATFGLLRFSYEVTAAHVEQGIRDGLARFPSHFENQSLPLNASSYCVPGYSIELEATPGAGAGISVRGLNISILGS